MLKFESPVMFALKAKVPAETRLLIEIAVLYLNLLESRHYETLVGVWLAFF